MGGKSSSKSSSSTSYSTTNRTDTKTGTIQGDNNLITNADSIGDLTMVDAGTVNAAKEITLKALAVQEENNGQVIDAAESLYNTAESSYQRSLDFAEEVSLPMSARFTEDIAKWVVAGMTIAAIFSFMSKLKGV